MTPPADFSARRRLGLLDQSNEAGSAEDTLRLAADLIERGEIDPHGIVIAIETTEGDLKMLTWKTTYAATLWILERAKLMTIS